MTTTENQNNIDHNSHINNFLLDYCISDIPPQCAVMLNGEWGSGKTWFIKELIKDLNRRDIKNLYISLYGMSNTSEIEYEFFRILHPVLSTKGAEITGKILKGLLKGTLKIDLDSDGKSDGTLSPSIPDIKLPDYLKDTSKHILIFDDIERCSIPIKQLLGYINYFAEHQDYKIILISNEKEIQESNTENGSNQYLRIKEKLVGKTFKIKADLDSALNSFIKDSKEIEFYTPLIDCIKDIYISSQYKNLRHLRQALLDFARLKAKISNDTLFNPDLAQHLLRIFLIFSCELRQGNLKPEDISKLRQMYISWHVQQNGATKSSTQEPNIAVEISKKYAHFDTYDTLLSSELWTEILIDGHIDKDAIESQLGNSKYLVSKNSPDWVKLWHFRSLSDEQFPQLLDSVWKDFIELKYQKEYELKHICGMYIYFKTISLLKTSIKDTIKEAELVATKLLDQQKLPIVQNRGFGDDESAAGLGFMCSDRKEFKDFCNFIRDKMDEAYKQKLPALAADLLKLMQSDPISFTQKLIHNNLGDCEYYKTPILQYINENDFIDACLNSKTNQTYSISYVFKERYSIPTFAESLTDELPWLLGLAGALSARAKSNQGKLSSYICKSFLDHYITPAINQLETIKSTHN